MAGKVIWPTDADLVQGWFAVDEPSPGVFRIQEPLHEENVKSFLVLGSERAALIDTGMGVADIRAVVDGLTSLPVTVINSHAHWDHIGGNRQFDEIWIHEAEAAKLDVGVPNERLRPAFQSEHLTGPLPEDINLKTLAFPPTPATGTLADGHRFDIGDRVLEVLHCPGHSPGGIALLDAANGALFSTDVAYAGALYVYDPADLVTYHASLARLAALAPDLSAVYPSHDASPIPPALLPPMRDAVASIVEAMAPTTTEGDMARYDFDGFAVQVWGMTDMR